VIFYLSPPQDQLIKEKPSSPARAPHDLPSSTHRRKSSPSATGANRILIRNNGSPRPLSSSEGCLVSTLKLHIHLDRIRSIRVRAIIERMFFTGVFRFSNDYSRVCVWATDFGNRVDDVYKRGEQNQ